MSAGSIPSRRSPCTRHSRSPVAAMIGDPSSNTRLRLRRCRERAADELGVTALTASAFSGRLGAAGRLPCASCKSPNRRDETNRFCATRFRRRRPCPFYDQGCHNIFEDAISVRPPLAEPNGFKAIITNKVIDPNRRRVRFAGPRLWIAGGGTAALQRTA